MTQTNLYKLHLLRNSIKDLIKETDEYEYTQSRLIEAHEELKREISLAEKSFYLSLLEIEVYKGMTLREIFFLVVTKLFTEEESFSGKRPLGDSDFYGTIAENIENLSILPEDVSVEVAISRAMGYLVFEDLEPDWEEL